MLQHHHADLLAAAPDAIAAAFGVETRHPHPLASSLAKNPFSRLAAAIGAANPRARPSDPENAVRALGLGTTDFHQSVASGLMLIVQDAFARQSGHREFCTVVEVRDYRPFEAVTFDAGLELPRAPEASELRSIAEALVLVATSGPAQLHRYAAIVGLTTEAIASDSIHAIASAVSALGASAGRTEARLLFDAVEGNPTLADGELAFHADHGNLIAAALDVDTLGQAMAALRNQRTVAGARANNSLRHLVVAPDLEMTARKLVHDGGLADITTHVAVDIPAGRWYAVADPAAAKTLAVLRLRGSAHSATVEKNERNLSFDGQLYRVGANLGAALLGRVGIVRGGA